MLELSFFDTQQVVIGESGLFFTWVVEVEDAPVKEKEWFSLMEQLHYKNRPMVYHRWTNEEIAFIQKNLDQMSIRQMAISLGISYGSVRRKVEQIKQARKKGIIIRGDFLTRSPRSDTTFAEVMFLVYLRKMAYECKRKGIRPNVNSFIEEYRKLRDELESSPLAKKILERMSY